MNAVKRDKPMTAADKAAELALRTRSAKTSLVDVAPDKPELAPVAPRKASATSQPQRSAKPPARQPKTTVSPLAPIQAGAAVTKSDTKAMTNTKQAATKKDPKLANAWKTKSVEELTDADVLAMSDDDYMNDAQLAFFRRKLVTLKNDMHVNAGETAENLREDTVVVPDPADRATIEEEHALELRTRDRERKLLKKIDQSIARIDAGDYGYCDETGEPIGVGRLLARPTATLSLEAQQRRELKQKMYGD
ncbi:RNA polymerase-binding protein DksA [Comamonas resistens]|uniref:RNA polymerase-binding transcription factor DksA n=1 Tax=Comamonas resistens TaxID=3046670 RepID=A0ABY8SQQ4_9BURK|nr:RNA polymerase-binding protein DksA [Comamonas resistens]MDL5036474.1 RNA polymerase-binding protein DksA [Comamonas resistens]WHS64816.1 RNA polymerase-binding protein DksA [Comamonas resistens]